MAKTDFGQNRLWPNRLCPNRLCPNRLCRVVLCCVVLCCFISCVGVGFKVWFGPPFPWTALPLDRPKFRSFFPSPAAKFVLFFPLWGSFRGILVVFETPGRSNVRVWSSLGLSCETPPHQTGPPGLAHDNPRTPNVHVRAPASDATKIPREDPQRGMKRTNFPAGERKKNSKFWAPHPSGPHP